MSREPGEWDCRPTFEGAQRIIDWFGGWPFHDAEILDLHLVRAGDSILRVHSWNMARELQPDGTYLVKHAVVTFYLKDVFGLELEEFNHQNVIDKLAVEDTSRGVRVTRKHTYGLHGFLEARSVRAAIERVAQRDKSQGPVGGPAMWRDEGDPVG